MKTADLDRRQALHVSILQAWPNCPRSRWEFRFTVRGLEACRPSQPSAQPAQPDQGPASPGPLQWGHIGKGSAEIGTVDKQNRVESLVWSLCMMICVYASGRGNMRLILPGTKRHINV